MKKDKIVNVCFITDNKYVIPTAVAIKSLVVNSKTPLNIYVLAENLKTEQSQYIENLSTTNAKVNIITTENKFNEYCITHQYVSKAALLKFELPIIFKDLNKIIYLDSDIVVLKDLKDLYDINIENYYAAAIPDICAMHMEQHRDHERLGLKKYFNSGVMLLNLELLRKEQIPNKLILCKKENIHFTKYMDQDCFNIVFREKVLYLSPLYNLMYANNLRVTKNELMEYLPEKFLLNRKKMIKNTYILHLSSNIKPWNDVNAFKFNIWFYYFKMLSNDATKKELYKNLRKQLAKKNREKVKKISRKVFFLRNEGIYKKITLLGIDVKFKCKRLEQKETEKYLRSRIELLDRKISNLQNQFEMKAVSDDFASKKIVDKTVLLVEPNNCHCECLVGMAKYFIDLNYNVDILIRHSEFSLKPFENFHCDKIKIHVANLETIRSILNNDNISNYQAVYFNSELVYGHACADDYFEVKNDNIIMLCHRLEQLSDTRVNSLGSIMLAPLACGLEKQFKVVNTHYFGDFKPTQKNKITQFIVVGNIEDERKDFTSLIEATQKVIACGYNNFKIVVVSRVGSLKNIPKELHKYIEFKGKLSYPDMFKLLQESDFILSLLNPENIAHERYITVGTSGTFQLSYGFKKPCIISNKFAALHKFTNKNSLIYENNINLFNALNTAIRMNDSEYNDMQNELENTAAEIYTNSLNNLEKIMNEYSVKR